MRDQGNAGRDGHHPQNARKTSTINIKAPAQAQSSNRCL